MQSTKTFLSALLIAVACLAIYGQSYQHDYINYDDEHHVFHERIIDGVQAEDLAWSFQETSTNLWHPATWLSYHLDGFFKKPSASHAINGVLHGLNCLLLFWLLRAIPRCSGIALLVALIHAIHPLHVESVAWVSSRKDVLSLLMMLASCLAYVKYVRGQGAVSIGCLVASVMFAILALLAKPSAVVLAPVLLVLDLALLPQATMKSRLSRTWSHFALCAALAITTMIIHQGSSNAELTVHMLWYEKIGLVCLNYVHYVGQFFYPHELSFFYRFPDVLPYAWLIASVLLMVLVVGFLVQRAAAGRLKTWHMCMILFLISYAPMCGLIIVSDAVRADRYMYLPYIFLSMALCDLARNACLVLVRHLGVKQVTAYISILSALWLFLLGVLAFQYTGHWKNNESLYGYAIKQDSKNYLAWHNLATSSLAKEKFSRSREQFQQVLDLKPDYKNAHLGIAESFSAEGNYKEAELYYQLEMEKNPSSESVLAYARFLYDSGQYERCVSFVRIHPDEIESFHVLLALSFHAMKNYVQASEHYQQALASAPPTDELLINHAVCLAHQEKFAEAMASLAEVQNKNDPRYKKLSAYLSSK